MSTYSYFDIGIVLLYMAVTMFVGFYYGRGVNTMKDYATGNRNFSTASLTSTVIATWISGSAFIICINSAYQDGILDFYENLGFVISLVLVAVFIVPRMKEFLGCLSVADMMGELYGKWPKIITAISGIIVSIGFFALQIKVIATILSHFVDIPYEFSIIATTAVVILYSSFGGIRAVTFTDVVQFIAFMIAIFPILGIVWNKVLISDDPELMTRITSKIINPINNSGIDHFTMFFMSLIPNFTPAVFSRILMGKNTRQISRAFMIAAFVSGIFFLICSVIGILIYSHNPGLEYKDVFSYMISTFTYPGLHGIVLVAIFAMAMSTLDSHMNSASVMFSHDICKELGLIKTDKQELHFARLFVFLASIASVGLALSFQNFLALILFVKNFYMPVVSVPLFLAIIGFRSQTKCVLAGMFAGISVMLLWKYNIQPITGMDSMLPSMFANLVAFMGSHYLFNFKGGWVGPRDTSPLNEKKKKTEVISKKLKKNFESILDLLFGWGSEAKEYMFSNSQKPEMYSLLGIIIITSNMVVHFAYEGFTDYNAVLAIQILSAFISAFAITYPLMVNLYSIRMQTMVAFKLCVYLIFSNVALMFLCGFGNISVINVLISLFVFNFFFRVYFVLIFSIISAAMSFLLYRVFVGNILISNGYDTKLIIVYLILVISVLLLTFFRRQQEDLDFALLEKVRLGELSEVLERNIKQREEKLQKVLSVREDIIRNVSHEIRTPLTIALNNAEMLRDYYKDKNFKMKIPEMIDAVFMSVQNLHGYATNMLDLSLYEKGRLFFDIKRKNLKRLLEDIVSDKKIVSLLGKENSRVINLNYEKGCSVNLEFDKFRISQVINSIIMNAANYSDDGVIEIAVSKTNPIYHSNDEWDAIMISIKDYGIGVPEEELEKIFDSFYISSRTKDGSGGKGLSLSLCRNIVEYHYGEIYASNNEGGNGLTITIILPINRPSDGFLVKKDTKDAMISQSDLQDIMAELRKLQNDNPI